MPQRTMEVKDNLQTCFLLPQYESWELNLGVLRDLKCCSDSKTKLGDKILSRKRNESAKNGKWLGACITPLWWPTFR